MAPKLCNYHVQLLMVTVKIARVAATLIETQQVHYFNRRNLRIHLFDNLLPVYYYLFETYDNYTPFTQVIEKTGNRHIFFRPTGSLSSICSASARDRLYIFLKKLVIIFRTSHLQKLVRGVKALFMSITSKQQLLIILNCQNVEIPS